jgi:type IV pilus assembly protein PilB
MKHNQSKPSSINFNDLEESNLLVETNKNKDPLGKLLNKIFYKALQKYASEINFEPELDCLKVIFCQWGICSESINPLNKGISEALINKLKIIANLENNQNNSLGKGSFQKNIQGHQFNFWLNIIPTPYGEKAILRWWNNHRTKLNLDELIWDRYTLELVEKIANQPTGLLLVTGPNNSGKSTTLYALLDAKKKAGFKILTIENRLKYSLANINQLELNKRDSFDYENAIQTLTDENVEVFFVDNLQELKKARMAINIAKEGYLVLSSLNVNDPDNAITKLLEIGIKPASIAKTLNGVINQRLLRKLCPYCRIEYEPTKLELNRFAISENHANYVYYANNTKENNCFYCQGIGYQGQIGVYEVLIINDELRNIIAGNDNIENLKKIVDRQGFTNLLDSALKLVMYGKTSFAEIERVFPDLLNKLTITQEDNLNDSENDHEDLNKNTKRGTDSQIIIELEQKLMANQAQNLNNLEEKLNKIYLSKIENIEQNLEILSGKYNQLEEKLKLFFSDQEKLEFKEELEELIDNKDRNDLTEELQVNFPLNSSQKKSPKSEPNLPDIEDPW